MSLGNGVQLEEKTFQWGLQCSIVAKLLSKKKLLLNGGGGDVVMIYNL